MDIDPKFTATKLNISISLKQQIKNEKLKIVTKINFLKKKNGLFQEYSHFYLRN